jgi:hypothetical protein
MGDIKNQLLWSPEAFDIIALEIVGKDYKAWNSTLASGNIPLQAAATVADLITNDAVDDHHSGLGAELLRRIDVSARVAAPTPTQSPFWCRRSR